MGASSSPKQLLILGTRGIPAAHGGFETFAEQLSVYLAGRGWKVSVYCQQDNAGAGDTIHDETWRGVTRIVVPVRGEGSVGSILFDWASVRDARKRGGIPLVLGYNTGLFSPWLLLGKEKLFINMDGIEWKRPKWPLAIRAWFWLNEGIAMYCGHVLFADHPEIARHLAKSVAASKVVMIPYGGYLVDKAPVEPILAMGLEPNGYFLTVCRIEPENSILEIVRAFSCKRRNRKLVVLGKFDPANAYHNAVRAAASGEVVFPGPIYDQAVLASLRSHVRLYCHGHTVGGTNPSLVEALGAGCPVLAQNNCFNTWVAGPDQFYFDGEASCAALFDSLANDDARIERARDGARAQFQRHFQLETILPAYERALSGESVTA
ncbi:MAG: DUF1972 domain-containing protein [Beijerinckiaceae bacterium]|jgi:glycosyltransferase involved in cell wall biosynthesis